MLLAGCSPPNRCEGFPQELREQPVRIWDLSEVKPEIVPAAAKSRIKSCYPKTEYSDEGRPLIEEEARRYGADRFILSYAQEGVSDARTAFVVESSGRISSAFQYGM